MDIRKKLIFAKVVIPGNFIDLFQKFDLKGLCEEIDGHFDLNGKQRKNKEFADAIRKIDREVICYLKDNTRFEYFPRFMKKRVELIMDFMVEKEEKEKLCLIAVVGKIKIYADLLEELEKDEELYGKIRKLIKK